MLETPEENFYDLSGFAYESKPMTVEHHSLSQPCTMESIVQGQRNGQEVFLLHSATSWGYGFRQMIPILAEAGAMVRAVDMLGFGRSSKFSDTSALSIELHRDSIQKYLKSHDVKNSLLVVCGESLSIGLSLIAAEPARFKGMVVVNGLLDSTHESYVLSPEHFEGEKEVGVAELAQKCTKRHLHDNILAGYEAPYPSVEYQAGMKHLLKSLFDSKSIDLLGAASTLQDNVSFPVWIGSSSNAAGMDSFKNALESAAPYLNVKDTKSFEGSGFYIEEDRGPELAHYLLDILHEDE